MVIEVSNPDAGSGADYDRGRFFPKTQPGNIDYYESDKGALYFYAAKDSNHGAWRTVSLNDRSSAVGTQYVGNGEYGKHYEDQPSGSG